jgi:drug/metabolite transporter (DMT)-like permease
MSTKSPSKPMAVAVAVFLTLIWGTTWAAIRVSLEGFAPLTGLAMRFAIGGLILLAAALVRGVRLGRTRYERPLWAVQAVFVFGISYGLVYWAEQWVPSGLTSVLFSTLPLFVVLFAWFIVPEERLGKLGLFGIVVGFAGVAVIFSDDLRQLGGAEVRTAASVLLLAPMATGFAEVAVKRWGVHVHSLSLTSVPMTASAAVLAAIALGLERHRPMSFEPGPVAAVLYLAVIGSAVTFSLFFWLMKHVSVTHLSMIAYGIPVVAVTLGTVFLDEPLTVRVVVGAALVVSGAALVMRRQDGPGSAV